jgi:hypothetical protein
MYRYVFRRKHFFLFQHFRKSLAFVQYFKSSSTNEKKNKYKKKLFQTFFDLKSIFRTLMRETISLNLAHWKSDYLLQFSQSSVAIAPKLNIKFGAGAVGA